MINVIPKAKRFLVSEERADSRRVRRDAGPDHRGLRPRRSKTLGKSTGGTFSSVSSSIS